MKIFRTFSLALRSLIARPLRTILTTFGIVLGVAVILAISITNSSTIESVSSVFSEASGRAQLVIASATNDSDGFSESVRSRVAAIPGVQAAVPTLQIQTSLADEASGSQQGINFFGFVFGGLTLYGIDPALDPLARDYKMVAGEFLSKDLGAYDVVLVKDYADEKEIELGQDMDILTPEGTQRLHVVGLMSKEGPGQLYNGAFGVLPIEAAQDLFSRAGKLDQIDIVTTPQASTRAALENLKATLQARLGDDYVVTFPAAQGERVTQMLNGYQMGLNFFSVIALFVGAFLIYNTLSMTIVERTREIGILRTLGMMRRQIIGQVLAEAGTLAIVGSVLGVGAGILLSRGLIAVMEILVSQEVQQVQVPLDSLGISVAAGLCVTLGAAMLPALQASRISPLQALRIRGNPHEGWIIRRGWLLGLVLLGVSFYLIYRSPFPPAIQYRIVSAPVFALFVGATLLVPVTIGGWERIARPWIRQIYGNEGQLGSSNIQRSRSRTTLTVATLMVGVSMILGIRAMTSAFEQDIRGWIEKYLGGDLYIYSTVPMRPDLAQRLEGVQGAAAVTPIRYLNVKWLKPDGDEENLAFMAIDPATYGQVTSFVFSGNPENPGRLLSLLAAGDTVFVSSVLAEKYGLQPGDRLRLKTRRGQRDFQVAAVVVDYYNQGIVIQGSWRDMRRYFGLTDVSVFLLKVQSGYAHEEVQARIDDLYGERDHLTLVSNKTFKDTALGLLSQTLGLFDVLALIAMIVAGFGVVNTLSMNVLERTRELGMLRSLGMTRGQIGKMILAEAGMMGLIGAVFGLVFGLFMSRLFLMAIAAVQGYRLNYVMPIEGVLVSLFIALFVSQLAAIWPAWRAARLRIIEAIQFE